MAGSLRARRAAAVAKRSGGRRGRRPADLVPGMARGLRRAGCGPRCGCGGRADHRAGDEGLHCPARRREGKATEGRPARRCCRLAVGRGGHGGAIESTSTAWGGGGRGLTGGELDAGWGGRPGFARPRRRPKCCRCGLAAPRPGEYFLAVANWEAQPVFFSHFVAGTAVRKKTLKLILQSETRACILESLSHLYFRIL